LSSLPGSGSAHLVDQGVHRARESQPSEDTIHRVRPMATLSEEHPVVTELKTDDSARPKAETFPDLGRHRDLALGGDRALHGTLRMAYPFRAPAVRPWIRWRWRKTKSAATGRVLIMMPAESWPHWISYCPTM